MQLRLHCKSPFLYLTLISTQLEVNVHQVDPSTGGFSTESQETLFVPDGEFEKADKTSVEIPSSSTLSTLFRIIPRQSSGTHDCDLLTSLIKNTLTL